VAGRTHLSIGEVLSLLQDDFPDLTITKIRFLESQGLIDPERTPSGYRKFYEFDIDRLRWILRQQRENFLPLKVIKGRLDGAEGALPSEPEGPAQEQLDIARDPGPNDPPPVWMADHAKATAASADANRAPATVATSPAAAVAAATKTEPPAAASAVAAPPKSTIPAGIVARPPAAAAAPANGTRAGSARQPDPAAPTKSDVAPTPTDQPQEAAVNPSGSNPPAAPGAAKPTSPKQTAAASPAAGGGPLAIGVSDVSMTRSELLGAAKLTEAQLTELESYGIVTPAQTAPDAVYGAEALLCARHASTFFTLGVEARHLRAFKVAADREAGLYEQIILPLLRQRNPAARAEAAATLKRLAGSGAAIHAALLHQSLRPHLRPEP
jgi:DNA-binding transcriptional MerR regulator